MQVLLKCQKNRNKRKNAVHFQDIQVYESLSIVFLLHPVLQHELLPFTLELFDRALRFQI